MPLIMWFVYSIVTFSDYSYISVMEWVKSPINCILITSMFASIFYHSSLGIQVVIEDYISEIKSRAFLLNFSKIIIILVMIIIILIIITIIIRRLFYNLENKIKFKIRKFLYQNSKLRLKL